MMIKKLIRKWLGIDEDFDDLNTNIRLLCRAIDETFELKKVDKRIGNKVGYLRFAEELKKYDNEVIK